MSTVHVWNGNVVAALAPAPNDLFVAATLEGRLAFLQRIDRFEECLEAAKCAARRSPTATTIKVLSMSVYELERLTGMTLLELAQDYRETIVWACFALVMREGDSMFQQEAYRTLKALGEMM